MKTKVYAITTLLTLSTGCGSGMFGSLLDGNLNLTDPPPPYPVVSSIARTSSNPSNAASVVFTVTFDRDVTGCDSSDFSLNSSGLTGASIASVIEIAPDEYQVTVNTGTGTGTLSIDLDDDDSIADLTGALLGDTGLGNGDYSSPDFSIDKTDPNADSINRPAAAVNPTNSSTVDFEVTFDEAVSGVDSTDFSVDETGVTGSSISGVATSDSIVYTVTVTLGTGDGTVTIDLADDGSIDDLAGNSLTGARTGDESYTVDQTAPAVTLTGVPGLATTSTSGTFTFTVTPLEPAECSFNGASYASCTSPEAWGPVADGFYSFTVRASDSLGNEDSDTYSFYVDNVAPTVSISSTPPALDIETRPTFIFSGADADSGVSSYQCQIDGGGYSACTSPYTTATLSSAAHTFDVQAIDAAGNVSAADSYAWTIDNTPPSAFTITGVTGGTDSIADGLLGNGTTATVNWVDSSGEDSYDVTIFQSNGVDVQCATANVAANTTAHTFSSCTLTAGDSYNIQIVAKDAIDNQTAASNALFAFSVSTDPPAAVDITGPAAAVVSTCVPFYAEVLTAGALPASVASDTTVNLAVNNSTGEFFSDSACTGGNEITSVDVTTGNYRALVYFESTTTPETATLIATSTGLSPGSLDVTVSGIATNLQLVSPLEIKTGECRAVTVSQHDAGGFEVARDTATVIDLTQDENLLFYATSACSGASISQTTINTYSSRSTFYVRDAFVQTVNLTASDNGSVLTSAMSSIDAVANLDWWDSSWGERVQVNISNLDQSVAHTDQPILLSLDSSRIDYSKTQSGGEDLRIILSDQSTVLSHEIELWDETGTSYVWVKVPLIQLSSIENYVFIYYDNSGASDGQNFSDVWTNFWGVWHLGEDPGGSAPQYLDSTGAGTKDGTATNSPSRGTGVVGYGVDFTAAGDSIDTGFNLATVVGRTSTFSAWMRSTITGNNTIWLAPGITGVEDNGTTNDIFFGWIDATGRIGIGAGNDPGGRSNFVINDNVWRHVTMTRDETTGACTFYVNGVLNGSGTAETGYKSTPFSEFGIIADTGGTPEDFDGFVDELRFYDSVQSADQIRADYKYQAGSHIFYSPAENE